MTFDVVSCRAAAEAGRLEEWLHGYLDGGPWPWRPSWAG